MDRQTVNTTAALIVDALEGAPLRMRMDADMAPLKRLVDDGLSRLLAPLTLPARHHREWLALARAAAHRFPVTQGLCADLSQPKLIGVAGRRGFHAGANVLALGSDASEVRASENEPAPPAVTMEKRHAYVSISLREVRHDFRACRTRRRA